LPTIRHHCNLDCVGLGAKPRKWAPLTHDTRNGIKRVSWRFNFFYILYCKVFAFFRNCSFYLFSIACSFNLLSSCFLYLRIVDIIMLIISVIAVRLHPHLNVYFYGRFMPSSLGFNKFLIKLSHRIIFPTFKQRSMPLITSKTKNLEK